MKALQLICASLEAPNWSTGAAERDLSRIELEQTLTGAADKMSEEGRVIIYKGQRYFSDGAQETYTNRKGEEFPVTRWRSHCTVCGAEFSFVDRGQPKWPNRRCGEHKRPGSPA